MSEIFGVPPQLLVAQLTLGLINGSFYALLSLGLAVIFGMLNVINFMHGALYMCGAFVAYLLLQLTGISYWAALVIAPLVIGAVGVLIERTMLARIYHIDHIYGWLLTFGLALMVESVFKYYYGVSGRPYPVPNALSGALDIGFMQLPMYRAWVVLASLSACLVVWFCIDKTRFGAFLRAATEKPMLVQTFGINVPRMITLTYGLGVALAAFGGVLAAPVYQVSPLMGSSVISVVFAVVIIGGLGSIFGTVVTGIGIGIIEGLVKVWYPEAAHVAVFVVMALVLTFKPTGLFGRRVH